MQLVDVGDDVVVAVVVIVSILIIVLNIGLVVLLVIMCLEEVTKFYMILFFRFPVQRAAWWFCS